MSHDSEARSRTRLAKYKASREPSDLDAEADKLTRLALEFTIGDKKLPEVLAEAYAAGVLNAARTL